MTISAHLKTFAGLPVRFFDPTEKGKPSSKRCAWFVGGLEDGETCDPPFPEMLDRFLDRYGTGATALVIGPWDYQTMLNNADEVVESLVANRKRLPALTHLFFGDITYQECEISWINHGDLSPLLPAFPKLEEFRIRGATRLSFGKIKHTKLKTFAIESGGLPAVLLEEVWAARLPKLETLELWLGTDSYGGIRDPAPLQPLLTGKLFRKLRHLGLRNCQIADAVAKAVADSKLLARLEVLDLSLGSLTDAGAEALLGKPELCKLKKLDVHHHFLSAPFIKALGELPIEVDVSDAKEPEFSFSNYSAVTHVYRYIVASE